MYTDAHIHLQDLAEKEGHELNLPDSLLVCASAWNESEFNLHEAFSLQHPDQVFLSFGIHPQNPAPDSIPFLEKLIAESRIAAVGECGFDFFTSDYRNTRKEQDYVWNAQLSIAIEAGLPFIIHERKARAELFEAARNLSRIPAVVFHGWSGSVIEARSFLDRGVNAFFSAGKGLLRGHKNLRETVHLIDPDRILAETDAPWMQLRDEEYTRSEDIIAVYREIAALRGMPEDELQDVIRLNFLRVFTRRI